MLVSVMTLVVSASGLSGTAFAHKTAGSHGDIGQADPTASVELWLEPTGPSVYAGLPCERTDLRSGGVRPLHPAEEDHEPAETGTLVRLNILNAAGSCPGLESGPDSYLVYGFRFEPLNRDRVTVEAWYTEDLDPVSSRVVWHDTTGRHVSEEASQAYLDRDRSRMLMTVPLWIAQTPYYDATFFAATSPCAPGEECPLESPDTLTADRHVDVVPNVYDARFFTEDGSRQSPAIT